MKIKNVYKWTIALCLLITQQVFIIKSIQYKAALTDEPIFLSSGYSMWKTGDYRIFTEHPPLSKLLIAIPLLFLPLDAQTNTDKWKSADLWGYGHDFLYNNTVDADRILFLSRLPGALMTFLLGILIFLWSSKIFGSPAGFLSLAVYSLEPNILAWGGIAMSDIPCTFFLTLTIYFYWLFAKKYKYIYLILTGIFAGLTAATRLPAALIFPILFVLTFWIWIWRDRKEKLSRMLLFFGIICILGIISLAATYHFTEFHYYFTCLKQQFDRVVEGYRIFFRGKMVVAPWYYYFYAIAIKTPIPVLILYIACPLLAVLAIIKEKQKQDVHNNILFILVPVIVWLAFSSVASVKVARYALPVYPCLIMSVGYILYKKTTVRIISVAVLCCWAFWNVLSSYPHFLSYFNEFVGGSRNGYKYLVDSDLDLGQDIKGLKQKISFGDSLMLAYCGNADYRYYGLHPEIYMQVSLGVPRDNDFVNPLHPKREIFAVSVSLLQQVTTNGERTMAWLDEYVPYDNVGHSILLYDITDNIPILEHLFEDYITNNMWEQAERIYKRVRILDPKTEYGYYYIGLLKANQQKWPEAINNLSKAIEHYSNKAKTHYYLGVSFKSIGRIKEAEKEYREAIRINPNYTDAHYNLGVLLSELKRFEEAEKEYIKAIRINPNYAIVHNDLGALLYDSNKFEEAEKEYREAIRIYPNSVKAHYNLGVLLSKLKRFEEAEKEYREAIRINPNYADAHYNLGGLLTRLKRFEEAEKEYIEAIRINPNYADTHHNLGNVYYELKKYSRALQEFEIALSLSPNNKDSQNKVKLLKQK